jgi:gliding motility-associated-like protein
VLTASAAGSGLVYRWTPATGLNNANILEPTATPSTTTTYTLAATSPAGCTATDQALVNVIKDIFIPNAFSPNGDGTNDLWIIRHLEDYPNARTRVFDRYGKMIFDSRQSSGPWKGTHNNVPVPVGVYYYIIELGNGSKPFNGSVTVLR